MAKIPKRRLPPLISGTGDPLTDVRRITKHFSEDVGELQDLAGGQLEWQNLRSALVTLTTPDPGGLSFTVTHDLGKIPDRYIPNPDQPAQFYATAADQLLWDTQTITLRCNTASVEVKLLVM